MTETKKEFPVFPDPPPGGFVEDPDFKYMDDEERELIEWVESVEWRPMSKQEIRELFTKHGFKAPPLHNVVERPKVDAPPRVAD